MESMQRKEDPGNKKYEDTFNSPHTCVCVRARMPVYS